jgi:hypothetical protein
VRPQDSGVAAALVSTMQQVGGSIGTALLSTIAATATTSYSASHAHTAGFDPAAATHGYTVVFLTSALVFAVGGVLAAALFPSKQRLLAMRESVTSVVLGPPKDAVDALLAADA